MTLKKTVFSLMVLACMLGAMSSCKKCYTCVIYQRSTEIYCTKDFTADQMNSYETLCHQAGGVWSAYQQ